MEPSARGEPFIVYRNPNPDWHADFPAVTVTVDGDVLVLLRQCGQWAHDATFKHGRPLTLFETDAEMLLLRSTDGGAGFAPERTLFRGLAYDPVLCTLADGRVLAGMVVGEAGRRQKRAGMRGVLHRHLPLLNTVITVRGAGVWLSGDGGRTWPPATTSVALEGWENTYNLRRPLELADGTLILPVTVGYPWRTRYVGLIRSWDGGATWGDPSYVAEDPAGRAHYAAGRGYWQPAMAATADGDLLCVCVLDHRDSAPQRGDQGLATARIFAPTADLPPLVRTHSLDSGFTWSLPQDTGLSGDFPSLTALPEGRLLLTHVQRRPDGASVLAHVTSDGGMTWETLGAVAESPDGAYYYPSTVTLSHGELLTVFMAAGPDRIRYVAGVRWRCG